MLCSPGTGMLVRLVWPSQTPRGSILCPEAWMCVQLLPGGPMPSLGAERWSQAAFPPGGPPWTGNPKGIVTSIPGYCTNLRIGNRLAPTESPIRYTMMFPDWGPWDTTRYTYPDIPPDQVPSGVEGSSNSWVGMLGGGVYGVRKQKSRQLRTPLGKVRRQFKTKSLSP